MTAHTPGPWKVDQDRPHMAFVMDRPNVFITVDCRENFGDAGPYARLIAAAPELLEALERMEWEFTRIAAPNAESLSLIIAARAAIAKAKDCAK